MPANCYLTLPLCHIILHGLSSTVEAMPLMAVVLFNVIFQLRQGAVDRLNKGKTARGHAAKTHDRFAFGMIVGDCENFSVRSEPMRCSLDHLIRSLAVSRIQDLNLRS